ncbi:MAG: hypothetical protein Q7S28_02445 [bacterium]|nr:hypothetical protein [bacterium]
MGKPIDSPEALSNEQKEKIWDILHKNMQPDDRSPVEIVRTDYDGNKDAYLNDMRDVLKTLEAEYYDTIRYIQPVPGPGITPKAYSLPKRLGYQGKPVDNAKESKFEEE